MTGARSTVAAQSLRPLVARLRALGHRVAPLLVRAGLSEEVLADPAARVPHALAIGLWDAAAELAGDPSFGLSAAAHLGRDDFGVLPMLLATSATAREGLARLVHFHGLVHDPPTLSLVPGSGGALALVHAVPPGERTSRHVSEMVLAGCLGALRQAAGAPDASPRAVHFAHAAPADPTLHRTFFGTLPTFDAPRNALTLGAKFLDRPLVLAAPAVVGVLESHAEAQLTRLAPAPSLTDRVRAELTSEGGLNLDATTLAPAPRPQRAHPPPPPSHRRRPAHHPPRRSPPHLSPPPRLHHPPPPCRHRRLPRLQRRQRLLPRLQTLARPPPRHPAPRLNLSWDAERVVDHASPPAPHPQALWPPAPAAPIVAPAGGAHLPSPPAAPPGAPTMIRTFSIKAFKSVVDLELELGRVNVFIGENGCGKSNILEAMALAGAAAARKLDHEFLAARGIRLPEPRFLLSAFPSSQENILTELRPGMEVAWEEASDIRERLVISPRTDSPYPWLLPIWVDDGGASSELSPPDLEQRLMDFVEGPSTPSPQREKERALIQSGIRRYMRMQRSSLRSFLIYSPENTSLRTFQREGQILPLGVQGEGLFKLLRVLSATTETEPWRDVTQNLGLLDWFGSVEVAPDDPAVEHKLRIRDRYLEGDLSTFDERSANEGFLFLLFYFALVVSPDTPKFFAIDNIDASLNPKTCQELMRRLSQLAVKYDKQIIATTHNPAVLDGLDLNDDEQRLFVVRRNRKGHTIAKRVPPPRPVGDALPPRLSEAFMRGLLGGLPQNF